MSSSRNRMIAYWVATVILVLPFGAGGVADIMLPDDVAETFAKLGYPGYFARMLGVAKLLGMAVLLAPGLKRAKEWAYAGMAIDLVAAFVSHAAVDGVSKDLGAPVLFFVILAASWSLRPDSRRLDGPLV